MTTPLDPDPRYVEPGLEPVPRSPIRSHRELDPLVTFGCLATIALLAVLAGALLITAPQQAPREVASPAAAGRQDLPGVPWMASRGGAPGAMAAIAAASGTATYCAPTPKYCQGWGGDAHLGAVQSFTYGDRPYLVTVRHGKASTVVRVVSHCACGVTLIDLSPAAFVELAPLSRGRIQVTVERSGDLPQTDLEMP